MSHLSESIELTYLDRDLTERDLIERYGYVGSRVERALKRWSDRQSVRRMRLSRYELQMLNGALSRSFNHGETGQDETGQGDEAVLDLW